MAVVTSAPPQAHGPGKQTDIAQPGMQRKPPPDAEVQWARTGGQLLSVLTVVVLAHAAAVLVPVGFGDPHLPQLAPRRLVATLGYIAFLGGRVANYIGKITVAQELVADIEICLGVAPMVGGVVHLIVKACTSGGVTTDAAYEAVEAARLVHLLFSCLATKAIALSSMEVLAHFKRGQLSSRAEIAQIVAATAYAWYYSETLGEAMFAFFGVAPVLLTSIILAPSATAQLKSAIQREEAATRKQTDIMDMAFGAIIAIGSSGKDEGRIVESSVQFDTLVKGKACGRPLADFVSATLMQLLQFWSIPENGEQGQVIRRLMTTLVSRCGGWRQDVELRCIVSGPGPESAVTDAKAQGKSLNGKMSRPRLVGVTVLGEARSTAIGRCIGGDGNFKVERSSSTLMERHGFEPPRVISTWDEADGDVYSMVSSTGTGSIAQPSISFSHAESDLASPRTVSGDRPYSVFRKAQEDDEPSDVAPSDSASHVARRSCMSTDRDRILPVQDSLQHGYPYHPPQGMRQGLGLRPSGSSEDLFRREELTQRGDHRVIRSGASQDVDGKFGRISDGSAGSNGNSFTRKFH